MNFDTEDSQVEPWAQLTADITCFPPEKLIHLQAYWRFVLDHSDFPSQEALSALRAEPAFRLLAVNFAAVGATKQNAAFEFLKRLSGDPPAFVAWWRDPLLKLPQVALGISQHIISTTGAPISLKSVAKKMKENGRNVSNRPWLLKEMDSKEWIRIVKPGSGSQSTDFELTSAGHNEAERLKALYASISANKYRNETS